MKKFLCLICSLALLAAAVPFAACSNQAYVNYTLGEDGAHYIVSGVSGNKSALKRYEIPSYYCEQEGDELLPVTEIGEGAFMMCTSLYSVTLPDSLEIIGVNAFTFCALNSIAIPEGVTLIGRAAFGQCTALTEVVIPESVTEIQDMAFAYCSNLKKAVIKGGITELPYRAFYNSYVTMSGNLYTSTSLVSIYLPATLEKVHISALDGNFIEDIYFAGSKEQWDKLYFYKNEREEGEDGETHVVEKKVEKSEALPANVKIHCDSPSE